MSIKATRIHWNEHGEPRVRIEIQGVQDLHRFAYNMEHDQCEFADIGRRINAGIKRKFGRDRWRRFIRFMHGDGVMEGRWGA